MYVQIFLYIFLSVHSLACLPIHLSDCHFINYSACLSICSSIFLSINLFIHLSVCLSIYLSAYLSVSSSVRLSTLLFVRSVYPSICLFLNVGALLGFKPLPQPWGSGVPDSVQIPIFKNLVPYSQHFIFFVAYVWAQLVGGFDKTQPERLANDKHSSLLGPFCNIRRL